MGRDIFDMERLPPSLDALLRDANPWWVGKPGPVLPPYRRWAFHHALRKLDAGLAPAVVLRGPRQIGKTTLQLQLIEYLLHERKVAPDRILRVQFDELPSMRGVADPVLSIARWFENRVLHSSFNEKARAGQPAYLFLDEVQNLPEWAPQLKALVDHHTVKVLVTGSSALRIEAGRDSLAGRVLTLDLGTLLLREIAGMRFGEIIQPFLPESGLEPLLDVGFWRDLQEHGCRHRALRDRAFGEFSRRGAYPLSQAHPDVPWPDIADHLNETIIQRAIRHDLRSGVAGSKRDPQLLEEAFGLACRYAGQAPDKAFLVQQIQQSLKANLGWQRVLTYLQFLEGALLLRLVRPLELRLKRLKGNPKFCLCDHGLRASWLREVVPVDAEGLATAPRLADSAGHLAQSITGYFLAGLPHLDLAHLPEHGSEPGVDYVLSLGEKRIPVEVKYGRRSDAQEASLGLRAFVEKTVYHAPFAILVTMSDDVTVPDPRIVPISLPSLLLLR